MCLLALIHVDSVFTDAELMDFIKSNQDGYGFMRPSTDGTKVVTYKQPSTKNFIKHFRAWQNTTRDAGQTEFAMHTRMRTHGGIDFHNAHPHMVTDKLWLMHNGVLDIDTRSDQKNSDTIHYIEQVITPLLAHTKDSVWREPTLLELLGDSIGNSNKFVLCTPAGFGTVNKAAGILFRGSWFSNTYAWSLWQEDCPKYGRKYNTYTAYNSHNYGNAGRYDMEGYDMSDYGRDYEERGWQKQVSKVAFSGIDDEIKNFMEEVDYAAKEHFTPATCPVAWRDKKTDEYSPADVKALALVIVELEGVEGLDDYLDNMFSGLSDDEEELLEKEIV